MSEQPLPTVAPPAPPEPMAPAPMPTPAAPAQRSHRGAFVTGWVLIALGAIFLANNLLPSFGAWIAPLMFGAAGLVFLAWYVAQPEHHWPILVAGPLLTLAAVIGFTQWTNLDGGSVFFIGLALTFLAYAVLPPATEHRNWAYWPAGGCLIVAFLATGFSWVWPLLLIAFGAWLLLRRGMGSTA